MKGKIVSKRDEVYCAIKRDLIRGVLKPGEILNEAGLAEKFGVSKSPVREALGTLAFEQLVNPLPRAGYSVAHISLRDVQEMFALREMLEVECAGLAAERIGNDEIQVLEGRGPRYDEDPSLDYLDVNHEWHLTIARIAGNKRYIELVERVLDDMSRVLILDPKLSIWVAGE